MTQELTGIGAGGRRPSGRIAAALIVGVLAVACSRSPTAAAGGDADTAASPPTTESALDPDRSGSTMTDGVPPRWHPTVGLSWQWQLTGEIDSTVEAEVFDLDLYETSDEVIAGLRARGRRLICYVNAGALEPWRDDAGRIDPVVVGRPLEGWPDERWLDIRRLDVLGPVLEDRIALCAGRGFDGIELDNVDGYANDSGFPLTAQDQLRFNRFVADAAHRHGLAAGLKNAVELIPDLVEDFDFAVNEECVFYDECEALLAFIERGKPVFHAEYDVEAEAFCPRTAPLGLSSLQKRPQLDAWRRTCG